MSLYDVDALLVVAYRSETAGHVSILKADVGWNVHHMEKLIVLIPLQ